MTEKNNEKMSRRARYSNENVDPGGFASRKTVQNSEQRISNIRRSTPLRSNKNQAQEQVNIRRQVENNSTNRLSNGEARENLSRVNRPTQRRVSNDNVERKIPQQRISRQVPKKTNKKWIGKLVKYGLYVASLSIIIVFFICVYWISQAPAFDSKILDNNHRTIVYDVNGTEVAKLGNEIGDNATMDEVPQLMQDAILATEDNRFFEHGAVDYRRLIGAVFSNLTSGFGSQGGSTISQQLIKRTFLDDNKTIKRKVQEAYLAYKLEQNYDKVSIFNMYINRIYYSDGVYGLKTAARYYYDKELSELTLPQMALLAGLPQQPNGYNPYDYPENAKKRRDTVLYLMQYHGKITEEEAKEAQESDILAEIIPRSAKNRFLLSSSFDSDYTAYMSQVAAELRANSAFKDYDGDVLNLGLKVYTNLDTKIQKQISTSVNNNVVNIKENSDVAMVVLNNETSGVAALFGGRNFQFGGFNIATQSKLQPGSTIKPILAYGPAVEYLGWSTNQLIEDKAIPGVNIQNWYRQFHGNVTMNYALMMSSNIPAIKTYQTVGFNNVKTFASSVGIEVNDNSITSAIGGSSDGYSPLQMAGAFVPFSNGGNYATPKTIRQVFDNEGDEIVSFSVNDRKQVMKDTTAYIMTSMLRNVLGGNAQYAKVSGVDTAVKTGTTTFSEADANKYGFDLDDAAKDSWIVGYNSRYTISVWQGFGEIDDSTKYLTLQDTSKTQMLYQVNMQAISNMYPASSFKVPNNVGTYNGGLKVLTPAEKAEVELAARIAAENQEKENSSNSNNSNNTANSTTSNTNNTNGTTTSTTNSNTSNTNTTTNR